MTGYEILAELKQQVETRHIPAVAISANALPEDIDEGQKSGFDDYLIKPLDINQIYMVLDQYLEVEGTPED